MKKFGNVVSVAMMDKEIVKYAYN